MARSSSRPVSKAERPLPDADWRRAFRRRIKNWYARHARELPWRGSGDAYQVWVSEIMLQQTQVATVKSYFERFIGKFPTVRDLAAADEQDVLRLWEGLGYYRRARQLHRAAREIATNYGGRFPRDAQTVRNLPGIGRYTAGAILSIAFDQREPILEANTIRLLARLVGWRHDTATADAQRYLWSVAEAILPRRHVGDFNQALMELGSLVCTPKQPACARCPVASQCSAAQQGLQNRIPFPKRKTRYEEVRHASVVVRRRGRVLLRRCGPDERWAGLWDFPRFGIDESADVPLKKRIAANVAELTGVAASPGKKIATIRHGVTRFRITLDCYEATFRSGQPDPGREVRWVRPAQLEDYPLSVTGRKIASLLTNPNGA